MSVGSKRWIAGHTVMTRAVLVSLLTLLVAQQTAANEFEERRLFDSRDGTNSAVLRVISTTDMAAIKPVIFAFLNTHRSIAVEYFQAGSLSVYNRVREQTAESEHQFDLAMSSAMDLQIKLVNDGYTRPHRTSATATLPKAMRWRDSVFGFAEEPAAIVYNPNAVPGGKLPSTRFELLEYLRANREALDTKIVTYDIRSSGLGYLFASQDTFRTETYWRLMEVFGSLTAGLRSYTGRMLDDVAEGRAAIAYNVIAGYAYARNQPDVLKVMLPEDYVLVMIRSVLIPKDAKNPDEAGKFIDYLISDAGRARLSLAFRLNESNQALKVAQARRIRLDPGLLVFLDKMKRDAFLREWESAFGLQAPM